MLRSRYFDTMATQRNDFSTLLGYLSFDYILILQAVSLGVESTKSGEARRELYIFNVSMNNCLLSNYFCIILNLYRNPLLVSFIDQCYSSRSAAHDIIFTSLRRAHCRLSTTIAVELNRKLEFDPHDQMFISIAVYYYQYLQKKKLFRGNRFFHDYYFLISAILICFSISILLKP